MATSQNINKENGQNSDEENSQEVDNQYWYNKKELDLEILRRMAAIYSLLIFPLSGIFRASYFNRVNITKFLDCFK